MTTEIYKNKTMISYGVIFLCLVVLSKAQDSASFVDIDKDFIHRNLLQEEGDEASGVGEEVEEEKKKPVLVYNPLGLSPGVPKLGPDLFYDGKDFLMKLSTGRSILVTIFPASSSEGDDGKKLSTVSLNGAAISVKGGMIDESNFKVNLDWKSQSFGNNFKISQIQIHMYFKKSKDEYIMHKAEVANLVINSKQMISNDLEVKTKNGHKVSAPIGASFGCYDPGMFPPKTQSSGVAATNAYRVGITFPGLQLQVFQLSKNDKPPRFGPEWTCDSMMSIGLLVGIIVSLLFALICYWGFSMLANIQTMDRFDDPRGKSIHVPQSD